MAYFGATHGVNHTRRMDEILARNPDWHWKKPGDPPEGADHVVTGPGLPPNGGHHYALGALCDWLLAVEAAWDRKGASA